MKPQTVTSDLGSSMMLVGTLTDVSSSAATAPRRQPRLPKERPSPRL